MTYCAIDFGTSNSAVALPDGATLRLATVEGDYTTLPTAVFFNTDENTREFGRAALEAYIDGFDGRLMRSMKSILGSALADTTTDLGDGSAIRYTDVIGIFLDHLKRKAEKVAGASIDRAVMESPRQRTTPSLLRTSSMKSVTSAGRPWATSNGCRSSQGPTPSPPIARRRTRTGPPPVVKLLVRTTFGTFQTSSTM